MRFLQEDAPGAKDSLDVSAHRGLTVTMLNRVIGGIGAGAISVVGKTTRLCIATTPRGKVSNRRQFTLDDAGLIDEL
jgi:hypothetical protein